MCIVMSSGHTLCMDINIKKKHWRLMSKMNTNNCFHLKGAGENELALRIQVR